MTLNSDYIEKLNELGRKRTPFLFIIDFEMKAPLVYTLDDVGGDILYTINEKSNVAFYQPNKKTIDYSCMPYDKHKYSRQLEKVIEEINYGNSFLLNLAAIHQIITEASLLDIFAVSSAPYRLYYKDNFVVFSPESFVKIENGLIRSFPMKGTIDASLPNAAQIILDDKKEKAEHNTIVDLIRNDLSMVAKNVRVKRFRYIDTIRSPERELLQVSSEIEGILPDKYHTQIGSIMAKLLPAGSISGAPKPKTVEIIKDVEEHPRNYYTGVAGIFDGYNLDSFVMIRFLEKVGDELCYRSGGGITAMSQLDAEYQEMINKIYVPTA